MSFKDNIMSIFQPAAPQPQQIQVVAAPAAPVNADPAAFQGTPQSPTVNSERVTSPLDEFTSLLKTGATSEETNVRPSVNLDLTKLQETVSGMDFGVALTAEDATKMNLSPEQAAVMNGLLNRNAQAVFLRAAVANSSVSEQLAHKSIDFMDKNVPQAIRNQSIQGELAKNAMFAHDAASPFVTQLAGLIAANKPTASPVEIAEQTQNFLSLLANGGAKAAEAKSTQDWNSFFRT